MGRLDEETRGHISDVEKVADQDNATRAKFSDMIDRYDYGRKIMPLSPLDKQHGDVPVLRNLHLCEETKHNRGIKTANFTSCRMNSQLYDTSNESNSSLDLMRVTSMRGSENDDRTKISTPEGNVQNTGTLEGKMEKSLRCRFRSSKQRYEEPSCFQEMQDSTQGGVSLGMHSSVDSSGWTRKDGKDTQTSLADDGGSRQNSASSRADLDACSIVLGCRPSSSDNIPENSADEHLQSTVASEDQKKADAFRRLKQRTLQRQMGLLSTPLRSVLSESSHNLDTDNNDIDKKEESVADNHHLNKNAKHLKNSSSLPSQEEVVALAPQHRQYDPLNASENKFQEKFPQIQKERRRQERFYGNSGSLSHRNTTKPTIYGSRRRRSSGSGAKKVLLRLSGSMSSSIEKMKGIRKYNVHHNSVKGKKEELCHDVGNAHGSGALNGEKTPKPYLRRRSKAVPLRNKMPDFSTIKSKVDSKLQKDPTANTCREDGAPVHKQLDFDGTDRVTSTSIDSGVINHQVPCPWDERSADRMEESHRSCTLPEEEGNMCLSTNDLEGPNAGLFRPSYLLHAQDSERDRCGPTTTLAKGHTQPFRLNERQDRQKIFHEEYLEKLQPTDTFVVSEVQVGGAPVEVNTPGGSRYYCLPNETEKGCILPEKPVIRKPGHLKTNLESRDYEDEAPLGYRSHSTSTKTGTPLHHPLAPLVRQLDDLLKTVEQTSRAKII